MVTPALRRSELRIRDRICQPNAPCRLRDDNHSDEREAGLSSSRLERFLDSEPVSNSPDDALTVGIGFAQPDFESDAIDLAADGDIAAG